MSLWASASKELEAEIQNLDAQGGEFSTLRLKWRYEELISAVKESGPLGKRMWIRASMGMVRMGFPFNPGGQNCLLIALCSSSFKQWDPGRISFSVSIIHSP